MMAPCILKQHIITTNICCLAPEGGKDLPGEIESEDEAQLNLDRDLGNGGIRHLGTLLSNQSHIRKADHHKQSLSSAPTAAGAVHPSLRPPLSAPLPEVPPCQATQLSVDHVGQVEAPLPPSPPTL